MKALTRAWNATNQETPLRDEEIILYCHGEGAIYPNEINAMACRGYFIQEARYSNIMIGKDHLGVDCFIMYVVDIEYTEDIYVTTTHYSENISYNSHFRYWDKQGEPKLHKYISYDGIGWIEQITTPESPQSVWWTEIVGEPPAKIIHEAIFEKLLRFVEEPYPNCYIRVLPIPYSDEFGSIWDGPKLPGPEV